MIELTRRELPSKDGFELAVHLEQDYEMSIWDVSGAYSQADIDAYQRFEWMFVGTVVTASRDGKGLGQAGL